MAKYIVVDSFTDSQDENVSYPVGALYPREGCAPTDDRVGMLLSSNNAKGVPLIKPLIELPAKNTGHAQETELVLDRESIKTELDKLGISYAKNAKTEILAELLEAQKQKGE